MTIRFEIIDVTPELAEQWLGRNRINRKYKLNKVSQYSRDMKASKWRQTAEPIKFGESGDLLDGQNRLRAIHETGVTVKMAVAFGVEDDTQGVMDSGTSRSAADNLVMGGYKNASLIAAIARRRITLTDFNNITNTQVHEYVGSFPEIVTAAEIAARHTKFDINPSTVGIAAWKIAERNSWEVADEFFGAASEMINLAPGDPVLAMTRKFTDIKTRKVRIDLQTQLSAILRAFNARAQGRPMTTMRLWEAAPAPGAPAVRIPIPNVYQLPEFTN